MDQCKYYPSLSTFRLYLTLQTRVMVMFPASVKKLLLVALVIASFVGCSKPKDPAGTVAGKITYKGETFADGYLALYNPQTKLNRSAQLDEGGNFLFSDIPPGEYVVLVVPRALDNDDAVKKIPIPNKLKRRNTTDLSVTVKVDEETKLDIELSD